MVAIDVECYQNYFLVVSSAGVWYEMHNGKETGSREAVRHLMERNTTCGFNSFYYDLPMIAALVNGADHDGLYSLSGQIINGGLRADYPAAWDHVDIKEVLPGVHIGLKLYAGRMHYHSLQDLPIAPDATIAAADVETLRKYCGNDVRVTVELAKVMRQQLALRDDMSAQYGVDLRSKSDAQIAEVVLIKEVEAAKGSKIPKPKVSAGAAYAYTTPAIPYQTEDLRTLLRDVHEARFHLSNDLQVVMPDVLRGRVVTIGQSSYRLGIGGLHSCEQSVSHYSTDDRLLLDIDVASYYPSIILQQRLYPDQCGEQFLDVYQSIVERRLAAKKAGDKVVADSLKITINGSFGKFGSPYSRLCSPQLMLQVTLTGQLALLLLIERLELAGIAVVSGNTDGIVVYPYRDQVDIVRQIYREWEEMTGFVMEETEYLSLHSRDVNSYIAVKPDYTTKRKGAFAPSGLTKSPQMQILSDAVADMLSHEVPIGDSVDCCEDMSRFITVRAVTGGATWRGEHVGKVARWYWSTDGEAITYSTTGGKVPSSDGATVAMQLPTERPRNLDIDRYITAAHEMYATLFSQQLKLF